MRTFITVCTIVLSSIAFGQNINWFTLEQANREVKANPKKPILFTIYTDWCGYCKRLDKETFLDPAVVKYVNDHYIAVKFNAETKDMVNFLGINYTYISGARANYLAYYLTQGRLSYPATVILDSKGNTEKIVLGYRSAKDFSSDIKI